MAAALVSPHARPDDDAALSAVRRFLQDAVLLYRAAVDMHRDDAPSGVLVDAAWYETLHTLVGKIKDAVTAMQSALKDDSTAALPLNTLPGACCKVGQDLAVHLDRFALLSAHPKHTGNHDIRKLWPVQDVVALGLRLSDLGQRYHHIDATFNLRQIPDPETVLSDSAASNESNGQAVQADEAEREASKNPPKPDRRMQAIAKAMSKMTGDGEDIPIRIPTKPQTASDAIAYDFILESLAYKSMRYREQEVTRAHSKTFEWVFNQPTVSHSQEAGEHEFSAWLRGDEQGPIYWITGKPGSGKSTLISFLFDHESTQKRLTEWAGEQKVCIAGFFFWTSGSREQRSQTGLLRSLLHQLLSENPELTQLALPSLWKKLKCMTTKERIQLTVDWTTFELMDAFQAFVDAAVPRIKLCLFVDGLDEFEGDHLAIIQFFKNLSLGEKGKSIKLCLSSRPWAVFQDAFQYAVPNLRLQDLTYDDMYRYAKDRLRGNVHIRRLLKADAKAAEQLIVNTVKQADGVFLWVRLALNEMIGKFDKESGLGLEDLAATLKTLPTELYDLFTKLLLEEKASDEVAEAAELFQLIRAREVVADFIRDESANALVVWELAFALRGSSDDELALNAKVEEVDDSTVQERCATTIARIRKRFAGLLDLHARRDQGNLRGPRFVDEDGGASEAPYATEQRVTYIHRTVRDWLIEEPGVLDRLVSHLRPGFDGHLRLLRSYVLRLKLPLEEIEHQRQVDDWWPDIALAMTHARYVHDDPKGLQRAFLNELNRTLSWYWLPKPQDPYDHWARNTFGSFEVRMMASPIWQPFLCLATKFGISRYVEEEVLARNAADDHLSEEAKALQTADSTPLLAYATEFLCSRNKTIFPLSEPRLVEFLLRNTCRVNPGASHEYQDFTTRKPRTPWIAVLRHLRDARRRGWIEYYDVEAEGTARWAGIVRLFLEVGGADPRAVVLEDTWDPEITALGVMELLEETYGASEVKELRDLLVELNGEAQ